MSSSLPQVQPELYASLFAAKAQRLTDLLAPFQEAAASLDLFPSPVSHYRYRTEFRIWHEGDDLFYAMFEVGEDPKKDRRIVRMDSYPIASEAINALMPRLLAAIKDQPVLRHRLFQVEFLNTLSGEMLVTLIYHRQLDEAWELAARALQQELQIEIIGRARKQKKVLVRDHVMERLHVAGRELIYQQIEGSFTQPNPAICQSMLEWALQVTQGSQERDLLELYCGNGNFTLALARQFRRVLGTEISRTSVGAAQVNIAANQIDNVLVARASAEELAAALADPDSSLAARLAVADYDFSTVLVDPPRAGLDAATLAQVQGYERIVYISCNPQTLADNLAELTKTHRLERCAFFDQFPYTDHIEAGVYLVRR
ncbi:tRNA (uridine(54)-C5)-methyltransferase TrmA [Marinospirillum sp. MEB164]|uniref:tRNA/tmRNA (uracil-C(5))-methyltransferase n=1 Tax=Marinospirillum alkalitolerans TaxID=3123374 RepID=A0ABW8PVX8_9GAMM